MASSSGMGSWIPQLIYDLIARVVPGFIVFATFIVILLISNLTGIEELKLLWCNYQFLWQGVPATIVILCGFTISYIIGLLLRGLYSLTFHFTKNHDDQDDLCKEYAEKYRKIKFCDENVGSKLSKMRAEIHLCTTLGTGWFLSYIFLLIMPLKIDLTLPPTFKPIALVVFSILIGILNRSHYRIRQYLYDEIDTFMRCDNGSTISQISKNRIGWRKVYYSKQDLTQHIS
jgi:hypothetical protein